MPPVVAAVAAAAVVASVGVAIGAVAVSAAIFSVAATAATAGLSYAMRPRDAGTNVVSASSPAPPQPAPSNSLRTVPIRQPTPSRRYVYGQCRTGGVLFFQQSNNPWLYIGTLISDGTLDAISAVYFGDTTIALDASGAAVTGTVYSGKFQLEKGLGLPSQAASALLAATFPTTATATFKQSGVARAVAKMHWGADASQSAVLWGGSVSPTYLVRGVRVYDPRVVGMSQTDATTWAYSNNPALCVLHALTHIWDSPLAYSEVDLASVSAAANVCDALVSVGGTSKPRFTLAGVFEAGTPVSSQISAMLAAMGGAITFNDGVYSVHADAPRTSVLTITDADVLHIGEVSFDVATDEQFGAISAEYFNADDAGKKNTSPQYVIDATGRATALSLLFCDQSHSAQILAYRALVKSLAKRTITLTVSDAGLWLLPHIDNVTINSAAAPMLNGEYEVTQVDLTVAGAALKLREYAPSAYADPATYLA